MLLWGLQLQDFDERRFLPTDQQQRATSAGADFERRREREGHLQRERWSRRWRGHLRRDRPAQPGVRTGHRG